MGFGDGRGSNGEDYEHSEQWPGTPPSTLYVRPLSCPLKSALLFPQTTEEQMRQGVHVTYSRLVEKKEKVQGCQGQMSSLGGNEGTQKDSQNGPVPAGAQVCRGGQLGGSSFRLSHPL